MTLTQKIRTSWSSVMDEKKNPLKNYSLPAAHMLMQTLAWMWSAIFSVWVGSYFVFGVTAVGHLLVIAGVFITLMVFQNADSTTPEENA